MIRFLLRAAVYLGSAALGLLIADWVLPGFAINWTHWWGFFLTILIFAVLQSLLTALFTKLTRGTAAIVIGGIGIISTAISVIVVALIPDFGVVISEFSAWFLAPLIVWAITAIATLIFNPLIAKRGSHKATR